MKISNSVVASLAVLTCLCLPPAFTKDVVAEKSKPGDRRLDVSYDTIVHYEELSNPEEKNLAAGGSRFLRSSMSTSTTVRAAYSSERELSNAQTISGTFPCGTVFTYFIPEERQYFTFTLEGGVQYTIEVIRDLSQCIFDPIAHLYVGNHLVHPLEDYVAESDDTIWQCGPAGDPRITITPGVTNEYTLAVGNYASGDCPSGGYDYTVSIDPPAPQVLPCTPVAIEPLDSDVVFVEGSSGAPTNNGEFAVSVISGEVETFEWAISCDGATFTSTDTQSTQLIFEVGTIPTICDLQVSVCGCGNCVNSVATVTVVDPTAGFVAGGGWIMSPEGAYPSVPLAAGKALFGFVSKYKRGQSLPSGETKFTFSAVDFKFDSTSYDWLVITGSDCAKFKGEGTVNQNPDYGFMLTACDNGEPAVDDTFHIKIWSTIDDSVVYDNFMGEDDDSYEGGDIGGGNIQIHQQGGNNRLLRG